MSIIFKRRAFLGGILAIAAEPVLEPVRRTYSFIWTPLEPKLEIVPPPPWPDSEMARRFIANQWITPLGGLGYLFARRIVELA